MTRSRRAVTPIGRLAIVAIAAGLVPTVAACDAGNNAPTLQFHAQSDGIDTTFNGIEIRDAFVLGPAGDGTIPAGQSAGLYLAIYNNTSSADTLLGATASTVAKSVTLAAANGIRIGSYQAAYLTGPKAKIVLTGLTKALQSGTTVPVTLSFGSAGDVTLDLPVLSRSDNYGTFPPVPSPSPTATATKTGKTSVRPTSPPVSSSPSTSSTASPNPTA